MRVQFQEGDLQAWVDFSSPIDISIPLDDRGPNPKAFYIEPPRFEPVRVGSFVGSVAEGGSCNCENLHINAHGNGTHTECVGHISKERITINQELKTFHFLAQLISVTPEKSPNGDQIITKECLNQHLFEGCLAIIVRSLPDFDGKAFQDYSGNNPCYFSADALAYLRDLGFKHLLTDLPSVDREEDGGLLQAHHAWWQYPGEYRKGATITEMIHVGPETTDGLYLLNLQIASFESDASPSKPVLYRLERG